MRFIYNHCKKINAIISIFATLTSLFWSLILGWLPCDFCWYERICMYPLAIIYSVSLFHKSTPKTVTLILTGAGILLSLYHYLIQMVPAMNNRIGCTSIVSCAIPQFQFFGFITPPFLALFAFITMFTIDVFRIRQHQTYLF